MQCVLFVFWLSGIFALTSCIKVNGHLCVSDYWYNITCVLNITGNPVGQSSLKFTEGDVLVSCPLTVTNHSYVCDCKVTEDKNFLASYNEYDIDLCDESDCLSVTKKFDPSQNIQLSPPPELVVQQTAETFNVTCKSRYEDHVYLAKILDYDLLLQTSQSSESTPRHISSTEKYVPIDGSQLKPNAEYCIKARYMCNERSYKATWSEWSKPTCWKNKGGEESFSEQENILVTLAKSLGVVCAFVGVLLFVFNSPAARMKMKTLSHTPSPAPFFQPLFQQHRGNLQEWLSPQGKFVLTYQTEEILTTDAVTVVPKPSTKDQEEDQGLLNPSVVQLAITQCQTSYVGLPGMDEACPPVAMVCPGDTSYTQVPCSVWGINIAKVEVVSSPPTDFLETSDADSGCSCEGLTQSPECSLPNSPADDSAPPVYCSDYCVLNKTTKGVVPVLVSKEGALKVPSDSLQKDDT